jgi:hypothetical protein
MHYASIKIQIYHTLLTGIAAKSGVLPLDCIDSTTSGFTLEDLTSSNYKYGSKITLAQQGAYCYHYFNTNFETTPLSQADWSNDELIAFGYTF